MTTLVFDTETTGLPQNWNSPPSDPTHPDLLQLGMVFLNNDRYPVYEFGGLVKPYRDYRIDSGAFAAHHISRENCELYGHDVKWVLEHFIFWAKRADRIVCHNMSFDKLIMLVCAQKTYQPMYGVFDRPRQLVCTMKTISTHTKGKWPKLDAAYCEYVDRNGFPDAHNATADCWAAARLLFALEDRGFKLTSA